MTNYYYSPAHAHTLSQEGQADAISVLLKHGADPFITDKKGRTGGLKIETLREKKIHFYICVDASIIVLVRATSMHL